MRCQRCPKPATLHITEVNGLSDQGSYQYEEFHFCEDCAKKYLYEPQSGVAGPKDENTAETSEADELAEMNQQECVHCGMKFKDFRSAGRLGCPNDYESFREELIPLLENIHGETQHIGKSPRRHPHAEHKRTELSHLRKLLHQAVNREDYEEAARLRDKIRQLEA